MGGLGHFGQQLVIGDRTTIAGFAFKIQGNLIAVAGCDVTVQAVFRDVKGAVLIPAGFWAVLSFGIGFYPGVDGFKRGVPVQAVAGCFPIGHAVGFVDLVAGGIGICGVDDFLRQGTGQPVGQVGIGFVEKFSD